MREVTKQLKIKVGDTEREFQIHKMNALAGSYLIKFCAEKLLPVYNSLQDIFKAEEIESEEMAEEIARKRTEKLLQMIPEALSSLPEEELIAFETRCLRTVDVLYPAGWQKVMVGDSFGDEQLEYDIAAVLRLVYEVLVFNLGSFFEGGSLTSLLNLQNSSRPNA